MAETSYPFPDQAITLAQFRAWARQAFGSRVHTGLNVTASGQTVSISAGTATVDGVCYTLDGTLNLRVSANTGSARRVYAVLELTGTAITAKLVYGPGGGGAKTDWKQEQAGTWQMPLAWVMQAAGAANVTGSATSVAQRQAAGGYSHTAMNENSWGIKRGGVTPFGDWTEIQAGERGLVLVWINTNVYVGTDNVAASIGVTTDGKTFHSNSETRHEMRLWGTSAFRVTSNLSDLAVIQSAPGAAVRFKPAILVEATSNGDVTISGITMNAIGL